MQTRRHALVQALAALGALQMGAAGAQSAAQSGAAPRKIIVGQSVPLTGPASGIGLPFAAGAKLYADSAGARKLTGGWTIEMRQLDDGYDATRAAANAQRLIDEGAHLLFGFVGAESSQAGAIVAAQRNVAFLAPFAAPDSLRTRAADHVFHVRPSMADEAFKMARHCATLGQTRIAVLAQDDAMGRAGLAALEAAMREVGLPAAAATAFVPPNSAKVEAAVAALIKAQPQAVFVSALFTSSAAVIRQMRRAGYGGSFITFSVVGIDPLFADLGKDISGVVMSQVVPSPRTVTLPVVKEYHAALDSSDQNPCYEGLEGFIAAKALAEAVRRAGAKPTEPGMLRKALASMTDYDVGGFRLNLRAGVRDASRPVDLITITADGRVLR
ncbi:MAG TPA: ABC transporter substrate-binding protein [Ramlibacter sp.]|nr:ABC transporter substrate-binding protein [Ramlibacter sp.]